MSAVDELIAIMARLRDPESGCPWDVAQDFRSIAPYTLEEAYEVADAIERDDLHELRQELGDLLLQVVFHARIAQEQGAFDIEDVARAICDKMLKRHPHVFGENPDSTDPDALHTAWEQQKADERAERHTAAGVSGPPSALADVALALPALVRAQKIQKRAARVGFDWPNDAGARAKLDEELVEFDQARASGDSDAMEDELGDVLFTVVNVARLLDIDAEGALRRATAKFDRRFRGVERLATERGADLQALSLDSLEVLWQDSKSAVDE